MGNAPGSGVTGTRGSVYIERGGLLKQCHPAISFVYLPDTTQGSTAELHKYLWTSSERLDLIRMLN